MSEEEGDAKCCGFAFGAQVSHMLCIHTWMHTRGAHGCRAQHGMGGWVAVGGDDAVLVMGAYTSCAIPLSTLSSILNIVGVAQGGGAVDLRRG